MYLASSVVNGKKYYRVFDGKKLIMHLGTVEKIVEARIIYNRIADIVRRLDEYDDIDHLKMDIYRAFRMKNELFGFRRL